MFERAQRDAAIAVRCPPQVRTCRRVRSSGRGGNSVRDAHPLQATRAIVVDEFALVRLGVAAVLEPLGIEVVAETHSGRELVSLTTVEQPDLVVIGTPADLPLVDVVERLRRRSVVVGLVTRASERDVGLLVALGIDGIALRNGGTEEFATVVERVLKGEKVVVPALLPALAGRLRLRTQTDDGDGVPLTFREREVLAFLAEGRTNREIAGALSVSVATVKSHLVHIYDKLGAANRNEAIGRAVAAGLLA
jgi:DNA-binding NarL/FixJ family response regulator